MLRRTSKKSISTVLLPPIPNNWSKNGALKKMDIRCSTNVCLLESSNSMSPPLLYA